jgi:hypothetical protein
MEQCDSEFYGLANDWTTRTKKSGPGDREAKAHDIAARATAASRLEDFNDDTRVDHSVCLDRQLKKGEKDTGDTSSGKG